MDREKKYKKTILIESDDDKALKDAAEHLRNGEVIGFPTETVYGRSCKESFRSQGTSCG